MSEQSEQLSSQQNSLSLHSFGMHFCSTCKNLMKPYQGNGNLLDFICERCNTKYTINFSEKTTQESLLYSKELQVGSKRYVPDLAYIFDATMPRVQVECPQCGFNKAVYFLTPDQGETKLLAVMICASSSGTVAKCGHSWVLEETTQLLQTKVQPENSFYNFDL